MVGFVITGFYEDSYDEEEGDIVANYMHTYLVTRAIKLREVEQWLTKSLLT